ncbi:MAG: hypothetical protein AB1403_01160 [Candidatus Riflebacteria bacterium]
MKQILDSKTGLGLVEILIALFCFTIAIGPVIGIFSFSIENASTMQAKTTTFSDACNVLNQMSILDFNGFPDKFETSFSLSDEDHQLVVDNDSARLLLAELPDGFARNSSIEHIAGNVNLWKITVNVSSDNKEKAAVSIVRCVPGNGPMGGRP